MVRFHRHGRALVLAGGCGLGFILGLVFGFFGALVGAALGAAAAAFATQVLDTQEKVEDAFYGVLSVIFLVALGWLGMSFWGLA
jgi:hypothetical protein